MRYIAGLIIFFSFCYGVFVNYKKFAKEANREILKEVRKNGYSSYKDYIKDAQRKEAVLRRKKRTRERWEKHHKKYKEQ
ncbi:hypothetical protein NSA47_02065 [Irregularibacter muris]|uniref:Uncharacterized protein n=1 Tax=Irregularibacter muris TaxID=1796619 RepID=A0AAE3HFR8_9FIRM|nr:hypothetical protein [Irregularibacter muris]MCR1897773.1 hypothetical protein [Irregularibacter muris]